MNAVMKIKMTRERSAKIYNLLFKPFEKRSSFWRPRLTENLEGYVLEIGTGTGANLKYYPRNCNVVGLDLNFRYLAEAKKYGFPLLQMNAENLAFKDKSFDYVIAPLCFCTIPDQEKAFSEVYRVLKPNGELRMIEHMKSDSYLISVFQTILNPINKLIFDCKLTSETMKSLKKSDLKLSYEKDLWIYDVFREIRAIRKA